MILFHVSFFVGCTGLSSTFYTTSTIISPNYPSSYPNGVSCTWTLQVNSGNRIQIDVTYFETGIYVITFFEGDFLQMKRAKSILDTFINTYTMITTVTEFHMLFVSYFLTVIND